MTFKSQTASLTDPMTSIFDAHMGGLSSLGSMLSDLNSTSSGLFSVFTSGITSFMSQMGNVATIQYLIIKIQTLLQRLVATLLVMVYSMNSLVQGIIGIQQDATFRAMANALRVF